MSGAISGIYVEIKGDASQLKKELKDARQSVAEQARGMSDALNNALSPAQVKNNINGIIRNLNTLSNASKLTGKEFGAIGADLKDLQRLTGITAAEFGKLQARMLERSSANAQAKALKGIADAAGLTESEIKSLAKQMNVGEAALSKILPPAKEVVVELSRMQKSVNQVAASFSNFSKGAGLGSISTPLAELAANSRLSASELTKLQDILASVQSAKAQEQAIRSIGAATGMTAAEMAALGHKMGVSASVMKSLAASARPVTQELSAAQREVNSFAASLNTLKGGKSVLGDVAQSLAVLASKSGLADTELRKLQARLVQTQANNAQEKALRDIGRAAGMTTDEMVRLGRQMGVSASVLDRLAAEANKTKRAVASIDDSARSSSASMTMLGSAAKTALAYFSVQTVIEFGRAVLDAGIAMDSLQRSFVAVTGSQTAAAETMAFLRKESDRLGQNFYTLAPEFMKIMAAAKGTAMEGEEVRKMFVAIAAASSVLGMSVEDTSGTLRALQQMMSKEKIAAEELRGQLGERMPDAVRLMAKGMGIGTEALNEMLEKGLVISDKVLPSFTKAVSGAYEAAAETAALESAQAAVNRLSQSWTDFKTNLFDNDNAVAGINAITNAIKTLTEYAGLRSVSDTFSQGAGLADQGLIDWGEFTSAGYLARQKMVDEFLDSQRVAAKNFTTIWAAAEKQSMSSFDSYNNKKSEITAKAANDERVVVEKANAELKKLTQTARDRLDEQYNDMKSKVTDKAALEKWYSDEVAKLNEKQTKKHSSELSKQVKDVEKSAKVKAQALKEAAEEAEKAAAQQAQDIEDLEMEMLAQRVKNYEDAANARAKAEKDAADEALKLMQQQEEEAQRVMENISDATADIFYDLFQDIDEGWDSLWKSMKSWALRTLAEIAAEAATQQIIMPVLMSATGASSIGGAVSSLTGSSGLDLGSLFNLTGSGGGIVDSLNAWAANASGGLFAASSGVTAAGYAQLATDVAAASPAAAEAALALSQTSAAATTFTQALGGAAGVLGGIYQIAQGGTGNTVAGIGTGIAGAMAFTPAAPFAPLVAIGSQIAGSLFGEEEVHSPSVIFQEQMTKWGESSNLQFHTKDGADDEWGDLIAAELSKVFESTYATVETMLDALGEGYVEQLEESVVTWGRNKGGDGLWKEWDFGADMDMSELMAKATADIQDSIFDAAMNAFNAAGQDIATSDVALDALANISGDAAEAFKELQDVIAKGVQDGDVATYAQQLAAFQTTVQGLNGTWDAINTAIDSMTAPVSEYEVAVNAANATVDGWIDTLENLGFAEERLTEIESRRTEVVEAATAAMITAFDNDIRMREAQLSGNSYLIDSTQLLIDQEIELAEIRSKFGVDSIQYAKIEEIQAQERAALEQRYAQQAAESAARAQEAAAEAARRAAEEQQRAAEEQQRAAEEALRAAESAVESAQADLRKAYEAERSRLQDIIDTHNANVDAARDALIDAYDREKSALEDTADTFRALAEELADWRAGVLTGADSPLPAARREALVASEFQSTANRAMLGDPEALGELTGKSQEYIDIARANSRTQEDYARTVGGVLEVTQQAQTVAERHASIAEQQLAALEAQIENLGLLNEELLTFAQAMDAYNAAMLDQSAAQAAAEIAKLDEQVGALITINESVLSVQAAIEQLAAAQSALAAAQRAATAQAASAAQASSGGGAEPSGSYVDYMGNTVYADIKGWTTDFGPGKDYAYLKDVFGDGFNAVPDTASSQFYGGALSDEQWAQVESATDKLATYNALFNSAVGGSLSNINLGEEGGFFSWIDAHGNIMALGETTQDPDNDFDPEKWWGVKQFATGGFHSGGLRIVGENGPELEYTGPSRIWNAEDTQDILSGGNASQDELIAEIRSLREDLQAANGAIARNTMDTAKLMRRWDGDGMPETRAVA